MKNKELELAIAKLNLSQLNNLSGTIALKVFKNKRALKSELEDVMEQIPKPSDEFVKALEELKVGVIADNPKATQEEINNLIEELAPIRLDDKIYNERIKEMGKFSDFLNEESLVELKKITEDELGNLTVEQMNILDFMIE